MKTTLLELVDEKNTAKYDFQNVDKRLERVQELKELGLKTVAEKMEKEIRLEKKLNAVGGKYILITEDMIEKFLERLVKEYNNSPYKPEPNEPMEASYGCGRSWTISYSELLCSTIFGEPENRKLKKGTKHAKDNDDKNKIAYFEWEETKLEDYKTLPPEHAINRLKEEKDKGYFDYYTIASVKHIPDPILLGRITDCEDRFYLAQWDNDVTLDDLI